MSYIQSGYYQEISGGFRIENTRAEHVKALEKLQELVFPTLAVGELIRAEHYLRHVEVFPEGQFVVTRADADAPSGYGATPAGGTTVAAGVFGPDAIADAGIVEAPSGRGVAAADGDDVVGMTTTMRSKFDFARIHHTFSETIGGGWLPQHDPAGDWLYGLDIGVHPAYRGKGLARALYAARQALVIRLGLKGQLTVGMMNGYGAVAGTMSGEQYYHEFVSGLREDPTLSAQRAIGFEPMGLIGGYVNDPTCGGYGVLLRMDR
jgi:GNAT superfamily N-acetyltransferase